MGNNDRVSLILMGYPNRKRLKLLARARIIGNGDEILLQQLSLPDYRAADKRGFVITVEAFDWNCPQHISPRFTVDEIEQATTPLRQRIAELEDELQTCECDES